MFRRLEKYYCFHHCYRLSIIVIVIVITIVIVIEEVSKDDICVLVAVEGVLAISV